MKDDIIRKLNSDDFSIASQSLDELINIGKINDEDLSILLKLDNLLIIGEFLERHKEFNTSNLKLIEIFINNNLDNPNRLFVSDLIEFATSWSLSIDYERCIRFLYKYKNDDDYVQLISIDYIFENLQLSYIDEIYEALNSILHNPDSNQSSQVKSAFVLFRITNKKEFLSDLIDLVVNGDKDNKILMKNMLSLKHNNKVYFEYYNVLNALL